MKTLFLRPRLAAALSAVALTFAACSAQPARDPFPLSPEMVLLEKDGSSDAYRMHLERFHVNDLHAEWQRASGPDGPAAFATAHGGLENVKGDPTLLAAHEQRSRIAGAFLAAVRAEYSRRGQKAPFDEGARAEDSALRAVASADDLLAIEPILPAPDAGREWPRWRGPWGQGVSKETGLPTRWNAVSRPPKNIAWKTEIPGRGNSSPVIWGDRIYLTTAFDDGKRRSLACVRRSDGALLFVKDAPAVPPEGRVMAKNGHASATPAMMTMSSFVS